MIPDQMKTSGPNKKQPLLRLPFFLEDKSICPALTLEVYLKRTKKIRLNTEKLFMSFKKLHGPVDSQTFSRWIKSTMFKSGINVKRFSAYSTRDAVTSRAKRNGDIVDLIRSITGWTKDSATFARFYDRCIVFDRNQFTKAVLGKSEAVLWWGILLHYKEFIISYLSYHNFKHLHI